MKTNFHLMAVTIILLSASLAGCIGDDDSGSDEYDGPIDLVIFYDATSGMIESSMNNGQQGPTTGVTLSFDFADSTSEDGNITKITLDPDDGSDVIESDPAEDAVISYEWLTHGVFEITLGAEDVEGNTHDIEISVRIDMHAVWTELNTASATMTFDATPDCEDGQPLAESITIISTVTNQEAPFWENGENSDVVWSLINPEQEEVSSSDGTIPDGGVETWDTTTEDVIEGFWTLTVEVTNGDNVNVENDVTILYEEGTEDSPNPREE
jgi:hypothetical protein